MNKKLNELEKLNKSLKPPPKELAGKFLPEGSPKQFGFMFIGEMPSRKIPKDWDGKSNYNFGKFDPRCRFLQDMMTNYGVAGYATDIVKEVNNAREPRGEEILKWTDFLCREINIIQPEAIIVLGKRTYSSYKKFIKFAGDKIPKDIKVDHVFHYRQQGSKTDAEIEQRFSEVISKMR